jgi:phosphoserine phosphatase
MSKKKSILTLSAIGLDSPGLVSRITTPISRLKGNIIDVDENCRKGLFSIFLVIDFSSSDVPLEDIRLALKGIEQETELKVILGECEGQDVPAREEPDRLLVTILGMDRPGIISQVSTLFHRYNANIEGCRMIARGTFFSMEMVIATDEIRSDPQRPRAEVLDRMKEDLKDLCADLNQSVVIQSESHYRQAKKIVVFDVESCLISEESAGRFMRGLNDRLAPLGRHIEARKGTGMWARALADQAGMLEGLAIEDLEAAGEALELHKGAPELIRILKKMGYKVAFLSTGLDCFLRRIYDAEGLDYAFCNSLCRSSSGLSTGRLEEPVLTAATKNEILEFIMNVENIRRDQVVAVGDGSPRSPFMKDVGLSIACKPEETALPADGIFSSDHMLNILYCLGLSDADLARYRDMEEGESRARP